MGIVDQNCEYHHKGSLQKVSEIYFLYSIYEYKYTEHIQTV
jgi:hypothetical protein